MSELELSLEFARNNKVLLNKVIYKKVYKSKKILEY